MTFTYLIFITGDGNIRLDSPRWFGSRPLLRHYGNFRKFGLHQLVDQPTHDAGAILDIVICSLSARRAFQRGHSFERRPEQSSTGSFASRHVSSSTGIRDFYRRSWRNFEINNLRSAILGFDLCNSSYILNKLTRMPWQHITLLSSRSYSTASHQMLASHVAQRSSPWFDEACRRNKEERLKARKKIIVSLLGSMDSIEWDIFQQITGTLE